MSLALTNALFHNLTLLSSYIAGFLSSANRIQFLVAWLKELLTQKGFNVSNGIQVEIVDFDFCFRNSAIPFSHKGFFKVVHWVWYREIKMSKTKQKSESGKFFNLHRSAVPLKPMPMSWVLAHFFSFREYLRKSCWAFF